MKLVAMLAPPVPLEARAQELALETSAALAECRMRLSGEPPLPFARLPDAEAEALAQRLRAKGWAIGTCPLPPPGDESRLVARAVEFAPGELRISPRSGEPRVLRDADVAVVLRGLRSSTDTSSRTVKERKLAPGSALLTGGLKLTRTTQREVKSVTESVEHFLFLYDRAGGCAALYDSQLAFASLGPEIQPTRLGNMQLITASLRRRAPQARFDDRLLRLGKRPLPFIGSGERGAGAGQTHADTASSVDAIAWLLFQHLR
ncbi:MAG TPA: hypothetical protein VI356_11900 [Myxococcales bacterium]